LKTPGASTGWPAPNHQAVNFPHQELGLRRKVHDAGVTLEDMRLRSVPVEGGKVRVLALRPPVEGVITRVEEDKKRIEVLDERGAVRVFKLRLATGLFESSDGSWIRFL
jgi:hypothetical protein